MDVVDGVWMVCVNEGHSHQEESCGWCVDEVWMRGRLVRIGVTENPSVDDFGHVSTFNTH